MLLQEVAQNSGVKIDWNSLVKKTNTGISNAREYQMLWRHLAYHDKLVKIESGEEPLVSLISFLHLCFEVRTCLLLFGVCFPWMSNGKILKGARPKTNFIL